MIDINYTPPEEGYQPPYYRAVSAVTLTCRAVGTSGRIRYYWSSTCRGCFVPGGYYYSYSGHSRSNSFLRSRDAGTHTCSAYDSSQGISGSASTVMKIVGKHFVFSRQQQLLMHAQCIKHAHFNSAQCVLYCYNFWSPVKQFSEINMYS